MAVSWPALQGARATARGAAPILGAQLFYGLGINLAVPLQQRYGSLPVLLRAQLAALVFVAPIGLAGIPASHFVWPSVVAVAVLGIFGTGLAFVAITTIAGRVGATRGSVAVYLLPVLAIALGVVFRHEPVAAISLFGTSLVLLGAYLGSGRERN